MLFCVTILSLSGAVAATCDFTTYEKSETKSEIDKAVKRIQPLIGKRFSATDDTSKEKYTYSIGICFSALNDPEYAHAGVVQQTKGKHTPKIAGNFTKARIINGTEWVMLEYMDGDSYGTHCTNNPRKSIIMITCTPGEMEGKTRFIVENNRRDEDCFYLFEVEHNSVCLNNGEFKVYGLSAGSIVCIIFFTLLGVYLIVGFLYSRFVLGAKGFDQIPNYSFWQDFGNLQADGCDLVCRGGARRAGYREPRQYRGIGDDQLEEEDRHDDSLLPM